MNKLFLPLILGAILLIPYSNLAYAGNMVFGCHSVQDGPWEEGSTWDNCSGPGGIPGDSDGPAINHHVTISTDVVDESSVVNVFQPDGVLEVKKGASLTTNQMNILSDVFNHGTITVAVFFGNGVIDTFHNECTGVVDITAITFFGNAGNGPDARFINHGTINLSPVGQFANFGIFQNSGILNLPEDIVNVNDGTFETIASPCGPVGGELIPIETTSLILAGTQSFSWMIPVLVAGAGIGLVFVRTSKNS